ncbi:MAG: hypothetical protein KF791_15830 [Verrucomicrobiae bacterium]|nr:hypothetical protein [Verrucomicrobiae bacterium]
MFPNTTDGSRLIVAEAKKATPEKPLLVIAGGPQTTVANALLTHPEIAPNLVVFIRTVTGGDNGKDGWSAYTVARRTRSVGRGGGAFWDRDSVFTVKDFEPLGANPFTADMKPSRSPTRPAPDQDGSPHRQGLTRHPIEAPFTPPD